MLRSLTVAVLITLGGGLLVSAHAQTDVSGSWTLTIISDQGSTPAIESPVGPMTLAFTGMVDGSDMKGPVDFGGLASGSWAAVKN